MLSAPPLLLLLLVSSAVVSGQSSSCGANLCFSSGFGSGGVLQRAPARAALYGSAPASCVAGVSLRLFSVDGGYSKVFSSPLASDGTWRLLLDAMPPGGNFSAAASCAGQPTRTLTDLTFGDVWLCAGQSNEWLPMWFTESRNTTTEAIAKGAYRNIRVWRGGLQQTFSHPNYVIPGGPEPGSDPGDALTEQWRRPVDLLPPNYIRDGEPWLWEFPATCFYAFAFLTDKLGAAAPPLGLLSVPVGGTMLEEWSSPDAQAKCRNVTCMCQKKGCDPYGPIDGSCEKNSDMYYGSIQPYLNMSIKGIQWLQGENNLEFDAGSYAEGTGYSCLIAATVADWRRAWSATPGTTDPMMPFVFASIADGSDESFGVNMARLRHAQTASFGYVPNAALPNTYFALAHDLGDPWDADQCANEGCCVDDYIPLGPRCIGDHRGFWSVNATPWFQGCVHPRPKGALGLRLAQALSAGVYGGAGPATGPVLSGCSAAAGVLTLRFNASLLRGASVTWNASASLAKETTALYVLPAGRALPADYASGHHGPPGAYRGAYASGNEWGVEGWVAVTATAGPGAAELTVDLSPLGGAAPTAVRYASGTGGWGAPTQNRMCCGPSVDVTHEPCPPDSCPLHGGGLPAVPFVAEIIAGKCACAAPAHCDE